MEQNGGGLHRHSEQNNTTNTANNVNEADGEAEKEASFAPSSLSLRGSKALTPFSPYIEAVKKAKSSQWSPIDNPDGFFLVRFLSNPTRKTLCLVTKI